MLEKRSQSGDITEEACIYMVLEYGEIDLAGMLSAKRKEMQFYNDTDLDENWLRFYWQVCINLSHVSLYCVADLITLSNVIRKLLPARF